MAKQTRFTRDMIDGYVATGLWDMRTIADDFDRNALTIPHREAVVDSSHRWTWADVKRLSDRIALGLLKLGIKGDDVVVAQLPNRAENTILWLALQKAGIVGCFPATTYRQVEMEQALKGLNAVAMVIPSVHETFDYMGMVQAMKPRLPALRHVFVARGESGSPESEATTRHAEPVEAPGLATRPSTGSGWRPVKPGVRDSHFIENPSSILSLQGFMSQPLETEFPADYLQKTRFRFDEVMSINLTSGSTGAPKLCELIEAIGKLSGRGINEALKLTPDDVFGSFAPMSGGPGAMVLWCPPIVGTKSVLLERFEAEDAFKLIESEKVTVITTVPALLVRMASHPDKDKFDLSSLRVIRCGGAALAPSVARELENRLKARIVTGSGSMDCFAFTHTQIDDPPEVRHFTVGKPFLGNEVRVVGDDGKDVRQGEVGEMWVRGACSGSGYYNDVEATKTAWGELGPGGWYRTGDLVKQDEAGNVTFVGRKKDMIIRGGQNIYPKEIENILLSHPKVLDVAIVGMPDAVMGEKACAFVIPKPGQVFTFAEMVAFLKEKKLANFKIPERLEIRDRFPGLVDGQKVDKKALAREVAERNP